MKIRHAFGLKKQRTTTARTNTEHMMGVITDILLQWDRLALDARPTIILPSLVQPVSDGKHQKNAAHAFDTRRDP